MIFEGEKAKSILQALETAKIKPYSEEQRVETEDKIREILKRRSKHMREILGENLEQFFGNVDFPKDSMIARSYKGEMYEVWSVPEETFLKMDAMSEEEFTRVAGEDAWWRSSDGSNMGAPNAEYVINGKKLLAWDDRSFYFFEECEDCSDKKNGLCEGSESDIEECLGGREYRNLLEYFEFEIGVTAERNIIALAVDLAKYNNMTVGQLFNEYQG